MINNQNSYDQISHQWDAYRKTKPVDPCVEQFSQQLPEHANVLDISCGSGYPISSFLDQSGYRVVGIDPSSSMINLASGLALQHAQFILGDFMSWQTDMIFDGIIAFDSLWHIPLSQQKHIYQKIYHLLKKDGLLLFTHGKTHGSVQGEMFGHPFVYHALDGEEVRKQLVNTGFDIMQWIENYEDEISGDRDLLVIARKTD